MIVLKTLLDQQVVLALILLLYLLLTGVSYLVHQASSPSAASFPLLQETVTHRHQIALYQTLVLGLYLVLEAVVVSHRNHVFDEGRVRVQDGNRLDVCSFLTFGLPQLLSLLPSLNPLCFGEFGLIDGAFAAEKQVEDADNFANINLRKVFFGLLDAETVENVGNFAEDVEARAMECEEIGLFLRVLQDRHSLIFYVCQLRAAQVQEDLLEFGLPLGVGGIHDLLGVSVDLKDQHYHCGVAGDVNEKLRE